MNEETQKGHGFIKEKIEDDNYVLGGLELPTEVLQPSGQWDDCLPNIELQRRNGLETMNCTVYGTLNAIEMLIRRLFSEFKDYSERYVGVIAKTTPYGNSPHKVAEIIRKASGLIDEELLPFSQDIRYWEQYYHPNPMESFYIDKGKEWLRRYDFGHEWVFKQGESGKPQKIKEALKYSPVAVSLHLRILKDGLYQKGELEDNHWVVLYGYKENEYWKVFDHYDNVFKRIAWDFDFEFAKRYHLGKILRIEKSICQRIKEYFNIIFS